MVMNMLMRFANLSSQVFPRRRPKKGCYIASRVLLALHPLPRDACDGMAKTPITWMLLATESIPETARRISCDQHDHML